MIQRKRPARAAIYLLCAITLIRCGDAPKTPSVVTNNDFLIQTTDSTTGAEGYRNAGGELIIPLGKYRMCFSDTFRNLALVQLAAGAFTVIDRQENVAYEVFSYDNDPDYPAEGLFRIVVNGKMGYADEKTYAVVIQPQFDCAFPFENGVAKVSKNCTKEADGEHSIWVSEHWQYIDKKGKEKNPPSAN